MEATLKGGEARVESVLDDLSTLVGAEHFTAGLGAAGPFLRGGEEAPGLVVVRPGSTGDVQGIVSLVREKGVSILTSNDRYLLPEDLDRNAILLDFVTDEPDRTNRHAQPVRARRARGSLGGVECRTRRNSA